MGRWIPFFEKLWSHCILVMAYTSHGASLFTFQYLRCSSRKNFLSRVVFLLRILWQRRRTCNLFTSKENASKCHKASHEDYILGSKNQLTILKVCWNWCHPLKHLLIKCCRKPSFSKPVHFAPLWKDCEICICKQALCIIWSLKSKDFKIPLPTTL